MSLKKHADNAVKKIESNLAVSLSEDEREAVARIVEQAIIDAVADAGQHFSDATKPHLDADDDKAHKIAEQLRLAQTALLSNLQGLR